MHINILLNWLMTHDGNDKWECYFVQICLTAMWEWKKYIAKRGQSDITNEKKSKYKSIRQSICISFNLHLTFLPLNFWTAWCAMNSIGMHLVFKVLDHQTSCIDWFSWLLSNKSIKSNWSALRSANTVPHISATFK